MEISTFQRFLQVGRICFYIFARSLKRERKEKAEESCDWTVEV